MYTTNSLFNLEKITGTFLKRQAEVTKQHCMTNQSNYVSEISKRVRRAIIGIIQTISGIDRFNVCSNYSIIETDICVRGSGLFFVFVSLAILSM